MKSVENKNQIIAGLHSEYGILTCKDKKVTAVAVAKHFSVR